MNNKRDRGKNFTEHEKELLVNICFHYKDTIENKKTNNVTVLMKKEAWEKIAVEFNSVQSSGVRDSKGLKELFENMKRKARKEKADDKMNNIKTEGGTCSSSMTPVSQRIIAELQDEPLENNYDSSAECRLISDEVIPIPEHIPCTAASSQTTVTPPALTIPEQSIPFTSTTKSKLRSFTFATRPSKKRKISDVFCKVSSLSEDKGTFTKTKLELMKEEHSKKLQLLDIQIENAALQKQKQAMDCQLTQIQIENEYLKNELLKKELSS